MQAAWGNVLCPVNGAEVLTNFTASQTTEWGAPLRYLASFTVNVTLFGAGQNDLSNVERLFRSALLVQNQDFVLYTDDGKKSSAAIIASETASGTRVIQISTPNAQGGEFVTRRTMSFVVTAEYHVKNSERAIISWKESVTITGNGGPHRIWRFPINAKGIRQTISPSSLVRAVQQGTAVGYRTRPTKPAPLFPDYLVNEAVQGVIDTPTFIGKDYVNWPVSWAYQYERGDGPLVGAPGLPPGII